MHGYWLRGLLVPTLLHIRKTTVWKEKETNHIIISLQLNNLEFIGYRENKGQLPRGFEGTYEGGVEKKEEKHEWWESDWIRNRERWKNAAKKLHLQFGHASKEKLKRLVEEAYRRKES